MKKKETAYTMKYMTGERQKMISKMRRSINDLYHTIFPLFVVLGYLPSDLQLQLESEELESSGAFKCMRLFLCLFVHRRLAFSSLSCATPQRHEVGRVLGLGLG